MPTDFNLAKDPPPTLFRTAPASLGTLGRSYEPCLHGSLGKHDERCWSDVAIFTHLFLLAQGQRDRRPLEADRRRAQASMVKCWLKWNDDWLRPALTSTRAGPPPRLADRRASRRRPTTRAGLNGMPVRRWRPFVHGLGCVGQQFLVGGTVVCVGKCGGGGEEVPEPQTASWQRPGQDALIIRIGMGEPRLRQRYASHLLLGTPIDRRRQVCRWDCPTRTDVSLHISVDVPGPSGLLAQ